MSEAILWDGKSSTMLPTPSLQSELSWGMFQFGDHPMTGVRLTHYLDLCYKQD